MAVKSGKIPELPLDVDDFASDELVEAMTTEEVGAYILLICKAWKSKPPGTIPDDDVTLAKYARLTMKRWLACRERVLACWKPAGDGRLSQKRLVKTAAHVETRIEQKKASGRKGGMAKKSVVACQSPVISEPITQVVAKVPETVMAGMIGDVWEDFAGCDHGLRELVCRDGTTIRYEMNYVLWEYEFISKWNKLPDVAQHERSAFSDLERRRMIERLKDHTWDWKKAFTFFPVNFGRPISFIDFLKQDFVQELNDGRYRPLADKKRKGTKNVTAGIRSLLKEQNEERMSEFEGIFGGDGVDSNGNAA